MGRASKISRTATGGVAAAVATALVLSACGGSKHVKQGGPEKNVKTFNFSGSSLSPEWSRYDSGDYAKVDSRKRSLAYQHSGILHVTTSGPTGSGLCLCSDGAKPTKPYGRWELKVKVSGGVQDHGFAILLWPNAEDWPEGGEIDLGEFPDADRDRLQTSLHYGADNRQVHNFTPGDFTKWHVIGVDWRPNSLSYYLDGELIMRVTNPSQIPHRAMHLSVQAGVNPGVKSPSRTLSSMDIDWIKQQAT